MNNTQKVNEEKIIEYYNKGMNQQEMAVAFGVNQSTISSWIAKLRYAKKISYIQPVREKKVNTSLQDEKNYDEGER